MVSSHNPSFRARQTSNGPGMSPGTVTMTERESIELLLLSSRGAIDAPEIRLFERSVVESVFREIVRMGYLRSLDSIPAMEIYPRSFTGYVFSAAGRIRFYHLERLLAASPSIGLSPSGLEQIDEDSAPHRSGWLC
jgi:hypothetical protein